MRLERQRLGGNFEESSPGTRAMRLWWPAESQSPNRVSVRRSHVAVSTPAERFGARSVNPRASIASGCAPTHEALRSIVSDPAFSTKNWDHGFSASEIPHDRVPRRQSDEGHLLEGSVKEERVPVRVVETKLARAPRRIPDRFGELDARGTGVLGGRGLCRQRERLPRLVLR